MCVCVMDAEEEGRKRGAGVRRGKGRGSFFFLILRPRRRASEQSPKVIPSFFVFPISTHLWPSCPLSLILVAAAVPSRCPGRRREKEVGRRAGSGESICCRRRRRRRRRRGRRCCRRRRRHRRRRLEKERARCRRGPAPSSRSKGSRSSFASRAEGQAAQHLVGGER